MVNNHLTRISFRVKPAERKKITEDAKLAGMMVGSYVRSRLLIAPITATMYRRSQLKQLVMRFIGHIGRVGNNMNQIAWKLNTKQVLTPLDRKQHAEGVDALKEMRALLIDNLLRRGPTC
jgi:hypothetical protein